MKEASNLPIYDEDKIIAEFKRIVEIGEPYTDPDFRPTQDLMQIVKNKD